MIMSPKFFRTAAAFRIWLDRHHARRRELIVGFYHKDTGRGGITYPEALDEALCVGWIDGVRRKHDPDSYTVRFTPRQKRSNWSAVNLRHYQRLLTVGRVRRSGRVAFAAWDGTKAPYSFEHREVRLSVALTRRVEANRAAWRFFSAQAPGYQRTAGFWVMSAKREATRVRRLGVLIAHSARRERIPQVAGQPAKRRA